jgi:imidazolonepropionase-like amidohydrolase
LLETLTTNPARKLKGGDARRPDARRPDGRVSVGAPADLVVFEEDPRADPAAFAQVAYTIRGGRVVYQRGVQAQQ